MAQRLMEFDVEARCGAGYDEKSDCPEFLEPRSTAEEALTGVVQEA